MDDLDPPDHGPERESPDQTRRANYAKLTAWVQTHGDRMMRLASRKIGDAAKDLVQEILLKMCQKIDRGTYQVDDPDTYLRKAIHNRTINVAIEQTSRDSTHVDLDAEPGAVLVPHAGERWVLTEEKRRILRALIETLPPRRGQAVTLRFIEGLSWEEIAAIMGIGVGTVGQHLDKGLRALLKLLLQLGYDSSFWGDDE